MQEHKIELNYFEQQLVLACKYHGTIENKNRIDVIKDICRRQYTIDEVDEHTIYSAITDLFVKIFSNDANKLKICLKDMFRSSWTGEYKKEISKLHVLQNMISEIALTKCDIFTKLIL